ncbi:hypothetical protein [Parablautia muri]|nr:hypothetical protein [Parablautia muri]
MDYFDGEHVVWDVLGQDTHKYSFHIADSHLLRIDFGNDKGKFQISNIAVKGLFTTQKISPQDFALCSFSEDLKVVEIEEERILIESTGNDPYVILNNTVPIIYKLDLCKIGVLLVLFVLLVLLSIIITVYYGNLIKESLLFLLLIGIVYIYINFSTKLEMVVQNTMTNDVVQVYCDDGNEGFSGKRMVQELAGSDARKYNFSVPYSNILRIDFDTSAEKLQISDVVVKNLFMVKNIPLQYMASCAHSEDIGDMSIQGDVLTIEITGISPYIVMINLDTLNGKFNLYSLGLLFLVSIIIVIVLTFITRFYEKINDLPKLRKKYAIIISGILFLSCRIVFLLTHKGFFSNDEFHHISTLNADYVTSYEWGLYINHLAYILNNIFGLRDLAVKLVPFLAGSVSFLCCLYLLYNIYDNPYWIITISSIITFMPNVIFNHFYIRMYVFLEAVIMIDSALFYSAQKKKGTKWERISLLLIGIITFLYVWNTKDVTVVALLMLLIIAGLYYFYINYGKTGLKRFPPRKIGLFCGLICIVILEIIIAEQPLIRTLIEIMQQGGHIESFIESYPVFLEFVFYKIFYISFPFIVSLIYAWKRKIDNVKVLFFIAGLPLLGYAVFFHNTRYLRTYVAFLPIMCISAYLIFDKIRLFRIQNYVIFVIAVLLTFNIQNNFWQFPCVPNEVPSSDLGGAAVLTKDLEEQGYEIVTMMTLEKQSAYFDWLDVETNLNIVDLRKKVWAESNTEEDYNEVLSMDEELNDKVMVIITNEIEKIFESDIKRVIIADEYGSSIFRSIYKKEWGDKCEIKRFVGNTKVIIVN